jgi:hypothetical protein
MENIRKFKKTMMICVSVCFLLINSGAATACTCKFESVKKTIARVRKHAKVIFVGEVTTLTRETGKDGFWVDIATFKVLEEWKSPKAVDVTIKTSGGCSAYFEMGRKYLVYAEEKDKNELWTNVCMRTGVVELAQEDFKILGKSKRVG